MLLDQQSHTCLADALATLEHWYATDRRKRGWAYIVSHPTGSVMTLHGARAACGLANDMDMAPARAQAATRALLAVAGLPG